jgi:hypothetical protein
VRRLEIANLLPPLARGAPLDVVSAADRLDAEQPGAPQRHPRLQRVEQMPRHRAGQVHLAHQPREHRMFLTADGGLAP